MTVHTKVELPDPKAIAHPAQDAAKEAPKPEEPAPSPPKKEPALRVPRDVP